MTASFSKPFLTRNASLPQQAFQKAHTDLALMRIGYDDRHIPASHLRMSAACIWALEA